MKFDKGCGGVSQLGPIKIVCERMVNDDQKWQIGVFLENPARMSFCMLNDLSDEEAHKLANGFEQVASRAAMWAVNNSYAEDSRSELENILKTRLGR